MFEITSGKLVKAQKVCIYGPEGIGKSTFASKFPDPLFIDTEGSTSNLEVKRLPRPTSYEMLKQEVDYVITNPSLCKTLVIDTMDWAEQLVIESILMQHQKKGIEDFGYGNGYVYVKEEFGRLLNKLTDVIDKGIHVVITAHAQIRKFEQPDELGAYDRYELKLGKKTQSQTSPLLKEWCDMILFANYKTLSVATDKDGKKHKAQGGRRVMYATHHPCWDAKNRHDLPDEMPFEYNQIAHIFISHSLGGMEVKVIDEEEKEPIVVQNASVSNVQPITPEQPTVVQRPPETPIPDEPTLSQSNFMIEYIEEDLSKLPKALQDLMKTNKVMSMEIQEAIFKKGYFPADTPIDSYPKDFIEGVLIGAWPQVFEAIKHDRMLRKELPFY